MFEYYHKRNDYDSVGLTRQYVKPKIKDLFWDEDDASYNCPAGDVVILSDAIAGKADCVHVVTKNNKRTGVFLLSFAVYLSRR